MTDPQLENFVTGLNEKQREAVLATEGPLLILAGAGSGKTRVLTCRIAQLLKNGVRPENILAVTFTNKAAEEMRGRVGKLVGTVAKRLWVSTFHSSCARILRMEAQHLGYQSNYVIYDDDDQLRLLKTILADLRIDKKMHPPKKFRGQIDRAKNKLRGPEDLKDEHPSGANIIRVYQEYEDRMKAANAMDFNDLVNNVVKLFHTCPEVLERWQSRFHYILVDEYQDTNKAQFELIRALAKARENIAVVGDDDQSIYSFRGADISNILSFEKHYPNAKVVLLEQNYRSTSRILKAAMAVVKNNNDRKEKELWTQADEGELIRLIVGADEEHESRQIIEEVQRLMAGGVKAGEIAMIYRTNAHSRPLEQALGRQRLPYVLVGARRFYERREVKDILAYLKLVINPVDNMSLLRVINVPRRGVGPKAVETLRARAAELGESLLVGVKSLQNDKTKLGRSYRDFAQLVERWQEAALSVSPGELVSMIAEESGYAEALRAEESDEAKGRLQNIEELSRDVADAELTALNPIERLQTYLDRVSLSAQADDLPSEGGLITLMTTHLAKGLEYKVVFVVGMVEGVFPHSRSATLERELEEERRLAYVAFTRAMERLYLTRPRRRRSYSGAYEPTVVSRFLNEIPSELFQGALGPRARNTAAIPSRFNDRMTSFLSKQREPKPSKPLVFNGTVMEPDSPSDFKTGTRVLHPVFGQGEIQQVSGSPGNPRLVVLFQQAGRKSLLARYAKLEILL
jgi:DNA helicase-2/ATP-dependent DNA helicase PcrA